MDMLKTLMEKSIDCKFIFGSFEETLKYHTLDTIMNSIDIDFKFRQTEKLENNFWLDGHWCVVRLDWCGFLEIND